METKELLQKGIDGLSREEEKDLDSTESLGLILNEAVDLTEEKANEVMHSTNSNAGAEWVPAEEWQEEIIDIVQDRARLVDELPGNHGTGLPKTYKAPAVGISVDDLVYKGKSEWTSDRGYQTQDNHTRDKAETLNITLEQGQFISEVDISDEQLKYNIANTEQYVRRQLEKGMAYTVDLVILNADSESGASGNVNLDDATPPSDSYYLQNDGGIRERAINGGYTYDVGTLAASDYLNLMDVLNEYAEAPRDVLFIQKGKLSRKAMQLDEFETVDKSGDNSAIQSGRIPTPYGSEILNHRGVPDTEADGKVSDTDANNTKGQILAIYKPAIQYGWGQDMNLEIERVPGYGFRLVSTFDFGIDIIDSRNGLTNPTIAAGINVTL